MMKWFVFKEVIKHTLSD